MPTTLIIVLIFIALFSTSVYRNSKFALAIKPYRGYVVTLVGIGLLLYGVLNSAIPNFFMFPVAFIMLGLFYMVKDHKRTN